MPAKLPVAKPHFGQPSWMVASDRVQARVTRTGGMMGPVSFDLGGRSVEPLAIAPWWNEPLKSVGSPLMQAMRGDFFCLPFGYDPKANPPVAPHGPTANAAWRIRSCNQDKKTSSISLAMRLTDGAHVDKKIELRSGQTAIYVSHTFNGLCGKQSFGHHPILRFSAGAKSGMVSTGPMRFGQVFPFEFEDPSKGGYSSLRTGAWFKALKRVPLREGGFTDLSCYPQREGFEDLVMIAHRRNALFAWTAVVHASQRYAWFSLKNPALLPSTVLWMSNGGRHYPPWSGRHRHVMGVEDVCSYFNLGRGPSVRPNPWQHRGAPTCLDFSGSGQTVIPIIFGVVAVPENYARVAEIQPVGDTIVLISETGQRVQTRIDLSFLSTNA